MVQFSKNGINIDEIFDTVGRCMSEGPGWTIYSIMKHQLVRSEIALCEGGSYFRLPKEL